MFEKEPNSSPKKDQSPQTPSWQFPVWYLVVMLVLLWVWQENVSSLSVQTIPYSQFKACLKDGKVKEVAVKPDVITGTIHGPLPNSATAKPAAQPESEPPPDEFLFRTVRVEDPELVQQLEEAEVEFVGVQPGFLSELLIAWILPIGLMILLWIFIARRMAGGGTAMANIGKNRARILTDERTGITFSDVAGCDEAKFELQELVEFLQQPDRYKSLGARIPKGVLLVGPPGTGKTLLAKAVAGEAKAPFFSLSGSDFVEMFVGVGAARVRDLFQQAKLKAPCLVFIDELDAIGRTRGVHVGAVNDEREQTLNQLLVEMDGFAPNIGVILLAATNRPEVLDRALLRPGRFDRQVLVDAPDLDGREAILKVHVRDKPLAPEVDLRKIARSTPGFSGADLANAVNEAALLAGRRKAEHVTQQDLEAAVEKVVAGPERKSRRLSEEEKRRVAFHEAGHALVSAFSRTSDPIQKITVVPRGRAALGYTLQLPHEQQFLMTRSELTDRIRGLLGGRAAEELVFGEVSTGAENDLERATALARQMVCFFGMSEVVGLPQSAHRSSTYLNNDSAFQRDCSEETAREVDTEVKRILSRAYTESKEILERRRPLLEKIGQELIANETIDQERFYSLIAKNIPEASRSDDPPAPKSREPVPVPAMPEAMGFTDLHCP